MFVEKGINKGEEKLFQLLSKKTAILTLFRMGFFMGAHEWRGKAPLSKICQTYPTIIKLGTLITYLKKIKKIYINHMTHPLISADISIFYKKSATFVILGEP